MIVPSPNRFVSVTTAVSSAFSRASFVIAHLSAPRLHTLEIV
jgi:hypothetical protein